MLKVTNIQCSHDDQKVLENVSFQVNNGEMCCLLGPSGCGKTTALRAIAGFQPLLSGEISLDNTLLSSPDFQLEPEHRNIGMVFQDYALFPHLSVRNNICFGLSKLPTTEQQQRLKQLLSIIKLEDIHNRYPHELSGGQQQRVALARALATRPQLLLLDEPFSNLDIDLRRQLTGDVREILNELGTSAILVTHDQEEAFAFSDNIGLLYRGKLQQWGTPINLYRHPNNRFVADFIGQGSFVPGHTIDSHNIQTELGVISSKEPHGFSSATAVELLLRPDDIIFDKAQGVLAKVMTKAFSGSSFIVTLQLPSGDIVEASLPKDQDVSLNSPLRIGTQIKHIIAFKLAT